MNALRCWGALRQTALLIAIVGPAQPVALAQSPNGAARVSARQLPAPDVTSAEVLGSIASVRQLPDGALLVNDQAGRRIILLDHDLRLLSVVADSTSNTNNAYGARPGGLIAYRGDSTLFVDPASMSMLVIDPRGKLARTMAVPRPNDVLFLVSAQSNTGFDNHGRLVYRARSTMRPTAPAVDGKPAELPVFPDTAPIFRVDLATRKLDTLVYMRTARTLVKVTRDDAGQVASVSLVNDNVLPLVDEWVVMTDGTVAVIRGRDYHVDFIGGDDVLTTAEKIPYEWQRMSDEDKSVFLDSTRVARERLALLPGAGNPTPASGSPADTATQGKRISSDRTASAASATGLAEPMLLPDPSDLPDYKPVFGPGGVRADMDNRIWVRIIPTKVVTGGPIYEVIDRRGKLADRVQIRTGRTIAGFAPGGVVYLGFRDAAGIHLERSTLR